MDKELIRFKESGSSSRPLVNSPLAPILNKVHSLPSITTHHLQIPIDVSASPNEPFYLGRPTETLFAFLGSSISATSCFDLIFQIMSGEEYNTRSSTQCNFLYSPVIPPHLA